MSDENTVPATDERSATIHELRKALQCLYLVADASIVADLKHCVEAVIDADAKVISEYDDSLKTITRTVNSMGTEIAELRAVVGPKMSCGHYAVNLVYVRSIVQPNYFRCRVCNAEHETATEIIAWQRTAREERSTDRRVHDLLATPNAESQARPYTKCLFRLCPRGHADIAGLLMAALSSCPHCEAGIAGYARMSLVCVCVDADRVPFSDSYKPTPTVLHSLGDGGIPSEPSDFQSDLSANQADLEPEIVQAVNEEFGSLLMGAPKVERCVDTCCQRCGGHFTAKKKEGIRRMLLDHGVCVRPNCWHYDLVPILDVPTCPDSPAPVPDVLPVGSAEEPDRRLLEAWTYGHNAQCALDSRDLHRAQDQLTKCMARLDSLMDDEAKAQPIASDSPATPASDGEGLKSCPFCGWSEPVAQFDAAGTDEDPGLNTGYVRCLECGTFGPDADTKVGGIAAWNSRSVPPAPDLNALNVLAIELAENLQCRGPGRAGKYYKDDKVEFLAILQRHFGRS